MAVAEIYGQRSPYAGSRPSGYKDRFKPESSATSSTNSTDGDVGNRLGDSNNSLTTSTERLPYDAYGDTFLVHHLNQLPQDKRPFWILNQAHIEAHRGTNGASSAPRPSNTAGQGSPNGTSNNGVTNRFNEVDGNSVNGRPLSDNIYNHLLISQQPIVYPVNVPVEQQQQTQTTAQQQQMQALLQKQQQELQQLQQQQQAERQQQLQQQQLLQSQQQQQQQQPQQQQQQRQQRRIAQQFPQQQFPQPHFPYPVFPEQHGFPTRQNSFFVPPNFGEYDD